MAVWVSHQTSVSNFRRKMESFYVFTFVIFISLTGLIECRKPTESQTLDVLESENVLLECRFPVGLTTREFTLYWIRSNRHGTDNVAIGDLRLEGNYAVDHHADTGTYDLRITNATYDRDNGQFECRVKEGNTGRVLHSKSFDLTVLLPPSPPQIETSTPAPTEGREMNLTCSSLGGSPPPQIKWYRVGASQQLDATIIRGENRDEPTRSVLRIMPTKIDDGASFRCTVWNRALKQQHSLEVETKIFVKYFPRVTVGPENPLKVEVNDVAVLMCDVDAKPAVTSVKWTRNGRFIDTYFKHTIPKVTLQDSGSYSCSADNGLSETGDAELKLDVLYGPIITLPEQKEISEGEDVILDCQVNANPRPINIQWLKEGDERFHQSGAILRLTSVTAQDNGRYICSATNYLQASGKEQVTRIGNATVDINIKHRPGDTFITPEKPIGIDGKKVTLTCGANPSGYPLPQFRWWKEGDETTVAVGSEFTLDAVKLANAGNYHCQASNELGDGKPASVFMEVFQAPRMVTTLQPSLLKVEGDAGFHVTCSAEGKPTPKVHWFKDGEEILESSSYEITTTEQEVLPSSAYNVQSTLKFLGANRIGGNQLIPTDRGHYSCQFENEAGDSDSTMMLKVEHSPVVMHPYNKVAFDVGETAVIKCRMQAFPAPKYDWSFGNSILQNDKNFYNTNTTSIGDDVYEGVLNIYTVTESSYGDYICKATNKMGSKRTIIKLQPKGKPEQPTNVRPIHTSFNYVTLAWDEGFNGGYSDTKFMVQYNMMGNSVPMYFDCATRNPCNITRLEQHSQYSVRVKSSNERGESKYSEEVNLVTKVDVSRIPVPKNVHFEKTTSKASFQLPETPLKLVAKIELENEDGTWRQYNELPMDSDFGEMDVKQPVSSLRVRLCLETNELLCGSYAEALVVDVRPNAATSASLREPWVIGVIVVIIILALVAILIVIKCCCCKTKAKVLKSDDLNSNRPSIVHGTSQPPPYTSFGIENKGVDTIKDSDTDQLKANLYGSQGGSYGYHHHQAGDEAGQTTGGHLSNTNSANGGSVNSQDSLWNVKNSDGPMSYTNGTMPYMSNGYDAMHHQPAHVQMGFYGSEDYTHYPHPEEYLNDRNRQYLAAGQAVNGDAYAAVNKQRQRLENEYSPYGEVSGLPDPFHDGNLGIDISGNGSHPLQHLSFDESPMQQQQHHQHQQHHTAESGYSTPSTRSRRIIREIIV